MRPHKRTKIIATINSNAPEEFIRSIYDAGADLCRLNTAHMSVAECEASILKIRAASKHIGIVIDTKGPEVRTCDMAVPLTVNTGDPVTIVSTPDTAPEGGFAVNYKNFVTEVSIGHRILIDDGEIELYIKDKKGGTLFCEATVGGTINNRKSLNVPDCELKMPSLTPRDRDFIELAIKHDLAYIAHSFVRTADDIIAVRSILDTYQSPVRIIAKIEDRQGVRNLDSILHVADGIMVARGDLGVEIPAEEVPGIQKQMIYKCLCRRKPVITATQMLQSMIEKQRPTRAEVSDVANAVLDGSDAVMLSGETAQGKYPVEAVRMMCKIIIETERSCGGLMVRPKEVDDHGVSRPFWEMVKSAVSAAEALNAAIICNTMSGESARLIAAYRTQVPVYALTFNDYVQRQMALSHGVYTHHNPFADRPMDIIQNGLRALIEREQLKDDDLVVVIGNFGNDKQRGYNYMTISTPREMLREFPKA